MNDFINKRICIIVTILGIIISILGYYTIFLSDRVSDEGWDIFEETVDLQLNPILKSDPWETESSDLEDAKNNIMSINNHASNLNPIIAGRISLIGSILFILGILIFAIGLDLYISIKKN